MAACRYLSETERLPFLTGHLLEKSLGLKINTYNSAKQGNNTLDAINILLNKLAPLKPSAAILLPGCEDLERLWQYGTYWPPNPPASPLVEIKPSALKDLAGLLAYPVRVFLPNFYAALTAWHQPELPPPGHPLQLLSRKSPIKVEQITPQIKRALEIFISACQARQIRPILVTLPLPGSAPGLENTGVLNPEIRELFIHFNQIIREVGKKNQVQVIDPAQPALPAEYFYDACNLNAKGSAHVSELLAVALKSQLAPKTFN